MGFVRLLSSLIVPVIVFAGCGDSGSTASNSSTAPTTTHEAAATPLRQRLEHQLRRILEADSGGIDVDCVIEELRTTLSNEVVEAATDAAEQGEEIPEEAVDAAYAAGQGCSRQ